MTQALFELTLILVLLLANGLFAMAEIAIVSARKSRLRQLADEGDTRARQALALAASPNTFLATVQIGITLVGVLAAAFSGAALATKLADLLRHLPWLAPYADEAAFALVVLALTYATLVIGELVPKRIGLGHPEHIARLVAGPMHRLSRLGAPLVTLLGRSTDALLALLRLKPATEAPVSEDDVRLLIREGMHAGVFHSHEPAMVESVMAFDRRPVRDLMTPRAKIIWLHAADSHETIWHRIVVSAHTTFPVYAGSRDHVLGFVTVKDIYANLAAGIPVNIRDLVTPALYVPETMTVLDLLELFRARGRHLALATDTAGKVTGLVTLHNLMEAIVGDLPSPQDRLKPKALRRPDGSWLVDGALPLDLFAATVSDFPLPAAPAARTFADLVAHQLGHTPAEGETFRHHGYLVEIIDLDGPRVDKVVLLPLKNLPHPPPGNLSING
jgi:putative hemolysin